MARLLALSSGVQRELGAMAALETAAPPQKEDSAKSEAGWSVELALLVRCKPVGTWVSGWERCTLLQSRGSCTISPFSHWPALVLGSPWPPPQFRPWKANKLNAILLRYRTIRRFVSPYRFTSRTVHCWSTERTSGRFQKERGHQPSFQATRSVLQLTFFYERKRNQWSSMGKRPGIIGA